MTSSRCYARGSTDLNWIDQNPSTWMIPNLCRQILSTGPSACRKTGERRGDKLNSLVQRAPVVPIVTIIDAEANDDGANGVTKDHNKNNDNTTTATNDTEPAQKNEKKREKNERESEKNREKSKKRMKKRERDRIERKREREERAIIREQVSDDDKAEYDQLLSQLRLTRENYRRATKNNGTILHD
jgi:hypothetical protein